MVRPERHRLIRGHGDFMTFSAHVPSEVVRYDGRGNRSGSPDHRHGGCSHEQEWFPKRDARFPAGFRSSIAGAGDARRLAEPDSVEAAARSACPWSPPARRRRRRLRSHRVHHGHGAADVGHRGASERVAARDGGGLDGSDGGADPHDRGPDHRSAHHDAGATDDGEATASRDDDGGAPDDDRARAPADDDGAAAHRAARDDAPAHRAARDGSAGHILHVLRQLRRGPRCRSGTTPSRRPRLPLRPRP
jgi:hypothetical protein